MHSEGNKISYLDKDASSSIFASERDLDNLLQLKKYYKIQTEDPQKFNTMDTTKYEQPVVSDKEIKERQKYESSKFVQKLAKQAFEEVMKIEYNMINTHKPMQL